MSGKFASANLTAGQLNAIVKKLGGHDAAIKLLRGTLTVSESPRKWNEKKGIIYFSVTSSGMTGEEWVNRPESEKGFRIGECARDTLLSQDRFQIPEEDFTPTSNVTTKIAVLKGTLFNINKRHTRDVRVKAKDLGLREPNTEESCLIHEAFTEKEIAMMGLIEIVAMHELVNGPQGGPGLLFRTDRSGGSEFLRGCGGFTPGDLWSKKTGFAFAI
ncbi:MAG: hypothetical protein Q7R98_03580 [Candidatus Jorgensenbacteria bacterium]|nr:hypothetical protein [Candidatus Jorgensenbacteria bacterium]